MTKKFKKGICCGRFFDFKKNIEDFFWGRMSPPFMFIGSCFENSLQTCQQLITN